MKGYIALLLLLAPTMVRAGPPFQTDDPDPVAYQHFEAYIFELSDGTPAGGTTIEAPSFEMNWGAAPNLQLHVIVPLVTSIAPAGGSSYTGIGDTEFGAKYRLLKESEHVPEVGIFPFIELPSGNASRGLGVGSTWFRLPLWIQKSWGPWTTYGGAGEVIVNATGYNNYPFAGWLLQRQLGDAFTLGGELFGHGAEGSAATSTASSLMLDFGGIYNVTSVFQLLFAAGHSIVGQSEVYTYFSLYWTWGKSADEKAGNTGTYTPNRLSMLSRQ